MSEPEVFLENTSFVGYPKEPPKVILEVAKASYFGMTGKEKDEIKAALQYAINVFREGADEGLYPKYALIENGGDGIMPLLKAIRILKGE